MSYEHLEKQWLTNRQKRRLPKQGKFWCGCDMTLIHEGPKCKLCGQRTGLRRNKK